VAITSAPAFWNLFDYQVFNATESVNDYRAHSKPPSNIEIESNLPWEDLAAIPESYATAWTCLFRNLELARGQKLVIRGGMVKREFDRGSRELLRQFLDSKSLKRSAQWGRT
jgi:hypothetical protein